MKKVRQKLLCRIKGNTVCSRVHGGFFWPSPDCLLTQPRTVQVTAELATFSSRVIQSWFPKRDEEGTQKGGDRERNATRRQRNQFSGWKQTEREVWPRLGSVNSASTRVYRVSEQPICWSLVARLDIPSCALRDLFHDISPRNHWALHFASLRIIGTRLCGRNRCFRAVWTLLRIVFEYV